MKANNSNHSPAYTYAVVGDADATPADALVGENKNETMPPETAEEGDDTANGGKKSKRKVVKVRKIIPRRVERKQKKIMLRKLRKI